MYAVDWPAPSWPPPPKQPHSICSPRAAAETIPARNTTSRVEDSTAASRVASPAISSTARPISRNGSP